MTCTRPGMPSAESAPGAERDGIAEVVVEAPKDRMDPAETTERLQVDAVAAHDEVLPFDEWKAEVAREERVLEVGLVVGTGREEDDERRFARIGLREAL